MAERLLQLDDVRQINTPENVASLFHKIGYNAAAQQLAIDDLDLSARSAEAVWKAYMIADHQKGTESLQVLLFQLHPDEWQSQSVASNRMRSLAQSLYRRPSNFLLLGTRDYDQLMLVNPRKSFDADMNLKVSIRKLLIDRTNPTNYDRDRLEAIAARNLSPQKLYDAQCDAFDVEKLTKKFYQGYREIFEEVQRVIKANNPHPYFDDPSRLHQFSQRLLGRIMFLYFLQKKEFLGGDRNFLKTQYPKSSELEDTDFYTNLLEPVFFDTLNKQRTNHESPWGKIPYLNGGLFDRDYGVDVKDTLGLETPPQLQLPNSLFDPSGDKSILKFFNGYNFTISENVQGDEEAAVDPEMLGKVFENLLAADERGQSGTFYTPRGIVYFMCVESLSRYVADSSGMDVENIKKLIEAEESDIIDANLKQLLTKEQAKKLKQALESVKICDPAVGSGAFPLGMMQVMLAVRQAIARREGMTVQRGSLTMSEWKRDIIANNLYGVDIKPEAIEIAKLRMWLSMVVDIPTIDDVEPLPNLDYKLMCGDSLISTINGERLIPDPTKDQQTVLAVTPVQAAIQPLIDLQHQYFTSHADERKALREKILEAEKNVFRVAIADRRQYWKTEQRNLEQDIKRLKGIASKAQAQKQQTISIKLQELSKMAAEVERRMRSLNFFQWHLHFNEVFQQKGGFDIVIGNPPYGAKFSSEEKRLFVELFQHQDYQLDSYLLFLERVFDFLRLKGFVSFIIPNTWLSNIKLKKIRRFVIEENTIISINRYGHKVFDAVVDTDVIILQQGSCDLNIVLTQAFLNQNNIVSNLIPQSRWKALQGESINILIDDDCSQIIKKVNSSCKLLGEICYVTVGMKPYQVGKGKPVQTKEIVQQRIYDSTYQKDSSYRPLLRGKDIEKYLIKWDGTRWIKYGANLAEPRSHKNFYDSEKIVIRQTGDSLIATIDNSQFICMNNMHTINIKVASYDLTYILALINSRLLNYYFQTLNPEKGEALAEVKKEHVAKLPIFDATTVQQKPFIIIVDKILALKRSNFTFDTSALEREIDQMVYKLYKLTSEEIEIVENATYIKQKK